jgi:drug/metabolite transporter (DMT)-like permease
MMPPDVSGRAGRLMVWAALAACLSTAFGGSSFVAIRFLVTETDPLTVAFLRNGIATVVLLPLALVYVRSWPTPRDALMIAMLGAVFFGGFQFIVSWALTYTTSARAALALTTTPFLTLAVAAMLRIEAPTLRKIGGVALASAGVVIALRQTTGAPPQALIGDALVIAAALVGAFYAVLSARYTRLYPPIAVVALGVTPGAAFLWIAAIVTGSDHVTAGLSIEGWAVTAYLGVFGASLSYFLWLWALRHTTPTLVAVAMPANPLTALLLGATLLGEPVTVAMVAGFFCVVGGITLSNWQRRRHPRPDPESPS